MLLFSLTSLDSDTWEVVDEGEVVALALALALFSGAEKAEELASASGVLTVASVVLASAVLASAALVVTSGAALSVAASTVLVVVSGAVLSVVVVSLVVVEVRTDVSAEEAVPAESMGNWSV